MSWSGCLFMDNLLFQLRGLAPLPPLVGLNWDVLFTLMACDQAATHCRTPVWWEACGLSSCSPPWHKRRSPFVCPALALHNRSFFWDSLSVMQLPSAESFWTAVLLEYNSTTSFPVLLELLQGAPGLPLNLDM